MLSMTRELFMLSLTMSKAAVSVSVLIKSSSTLDVLSESATELSAPSPTFCVEYDHFS